MNVELTRQQARYLSVLAAQDIAADEARGLKGVVARHYPVWEALQPVCAWETEDDDSSGPTS